MIDTLPRMLHAFHRFFFFKLFVLRIASLSNGNRIIRTFHRNAKDRVCQWFKWTEWELWLNLQGLWTLPEQFKCFFFLFSSLLSIDWFMNIHSQQYSPVATFSFWSMYYTEFIFSGPSARLNSMGKSFCVFEVVF